MPVISLSAINVAYNQSNNDCAGNVYAFPGHDSLVKISGNNAHILTNFFYSL